METSMRVRAERLGQVVKACRDPWTQANIRANGDVMPCCHSLQRMGTLIDATLDEIWNGPGFAAFRRFLLSRTPLPVCEQCFVRGWRPAPRPSIAQRLRHAAEGTAVLLGLSEGREVVPLLQLDKIDYRPTDDLHLAVGLKVGNTARSRRIDLYVFADDPAGQRHWVRMAGRMTIVVLEPGPALPGFEPFSFEGLELLRMPLAAVPPGEYRLRAVATLSGAAHDDKDARLGETTAHVVVGGSSAPGRS
jgi:hypothetical protein